MLSKKILKTSIFTLTLLFLLGTCLPVHAEGTPATPSFIDSFQDLSYEMPVINDVTVPMDYRLFLPEDSGNEKYPLILFLHGSGERGNNNRSQFFNGPEFIAELLELQSDTNYKCAILAPQCPNDLYWSNEAKYYNYDVKVLDCLVDIIKKLSEESNVDLDRIYVTGLSMGGFGTWELLQTYPDFFAAGVPICGGGDADNVKIIKNIPIWAFHGDVDESVDVKESREMAKALEDIKGNIKYTEYAGVGHSSWDNAYAEKELIPWLFSQRKSLQKTSSDIEPIYIIIACAAALIVIGGVAAVVIMKRKRLKSADVTNITN